MKVEIKQVDDEDVSTLRFVTEGDAAVGKEVFNSEELQILNNRYRYIKNNKTNQDAEQGEHNDKDISVILNLSADIKGILDNLRNLGHPDARFQQTNYVITGNFKNLI